MLPYIIKRLAWFVPLFFLISFLAFALSKLAPGDPAQLFSASAPGSDLSNISPERLDYLHRQSAEQLGLNKAPFYCTLTTAAQSDTLYRILYKDRRTTLHHLCAQYGNWEHTQNYYLSLQAAEYMAMNLPDSLRKVKGRFRATIRELYSTHEDKKIQNRLSRLEKTSLLAENVQAIQRNYANLKQQAIPYRNYIPALHWHGFDNQYHSWLKGFLKGDFGTSINGHLPVIEKLKPALFWTLLINSISVFLAYVLAIYLGVFSAQHKGKFADKAISTLLFLLYSLPSFWVAILLVAFFTTPEYGAWTDIFPSTGLGNLPATAPFWSRFWETASHLILPVCCMTYGSLAFIARQTRGSMAEVLPQLYIQTARAKGLSESRILWKHAFRNALFPLITIFASVLPAMLTGSVIVEEIFNIPGMGRLLLDSIWTKDWAVVYVILMFGAILTMLGILIADLLYAWADPRVRL